MAQSTDSAENWHQYYDDPRNDTILITTDNIKFRVSSRLLSKHSAIVNQSSSTIDVQDNEDQDVKPNVTGLAPIQVDATCKTLELFLSMLSPITRNPVCEALTFEQCRDLLTFTERYDCKELIPLMRTYLVAKASSPGRPPDLMIFASGRDDWALGRDAMKMIDTGEIKRLFGIANYGHNGPAAKANAHAFFDKLRPDWQLVLQRLIFFGGYSTLETKLSETGWNTYAEEFYKPGTMPRRRTDAAAASTKKPRKK